MTTQEMARKIAAERNRHGYLPSDGRTIQSWDAVFFGAPRSPEETEKQCACGQVMDYTDILHPYLTGQWQCRSCSRLHAATVAETIGALRKRIDDLKRAVQDYRR